MHADAVKWDVIGIAQSCQQIVGVQHCILRNILQPIGSVHGDVGEGADEAAAEMSVEGFHASDGFGGLDEAIQRRRLIVTFFDDANQRLRQEVRQMRGDTDGTDARSAAAVRDGEGLVQVEVHHVEAQVAGADDAEQRVQVRAVAIHQAAAAVHQLDDLFDVLIEETERVRVGEHHADDGIVAGGFERFQVHVAAFIGWDRAQPASPSCRPRRGLSHARTSGMSIFMRFVSPRDL